MNARLALATGLLCAALAVPPGRAEQIVLPRGPADPAPAFEAPPPSSRFT